MFGTISLFFCSLNIQKIKMLLYVVKLAVLRSFLSAAAHVLPRAIKGSDAYFRAFHYAS